jgi:hypothetical protein
MRSTFRTMLVAVLALCALGAFASASASAALPEIKPYTANELITGAGGAVSFESGSAIYDCNSSSFTGTMVGPKELAKVVLTMNCGEGEKFCLQGHEGKWVSHELKGRLGYISKASKSVGLLLEPAVAGGPIATCENPFGLNIEIKGSVIASFAPPGEFRNVELKYEGYQGKQALTHFEGEEVVRHLERKNGFEGVFSMRTTITLAFKELKKLDA